MNFPGSLFRFAILSVIFHFASSSNSYAFLNKEDAHLRAQLEIPSELQSFGVMTRSGYGPFLNFDIGAEALVNGKNSQDFPRWELALPFLFPLSGTVSLGPSLGYQKVGASQGTFVGLEASFTRLSRLNVRLGARLISGASPVLSGNSPEALGYQALLRFQSEWVLLQTAKAQHFLGVKWEMFSGNQRLSEIRWFLVSGTSF